MLNRNSVKWNPFNALINGNKIIKELDNNNQKISKPNLSEDQLNDINKKMIDALTTKSLINLKYYEKGNLFYIDGIISYFDKTNNSIIINHKTIYLTQIIDIKFINF